MQATYLTLQCTTVSTFPMDTHFISLLPVLLYSSASAWSRARAEPFGPARVTSCLQARTVASFAHAYGWLGQSPVTINILIVLALVVVLVLLFSSFCLLLLLMLLLLLLSVFVNYEHITELLLRAQDCSFCVQEIDSDSYYTVLQHQDNANISLRAVMRLKTALQAIKTLCTAFFTLFGFPIQNLNSYVDSV